MKDKITSGSNKQREDIIKVEDISLTLAEIELIATSDELRDEYEEKFKNDLYSTLLRALTHESFSNLEAKSLWDQIVNHMKHLNSLLGRDVGIAVASLDYLSNIKDELSDPKIIEQEKSDFVAETTTKDELTGLFLREIFDVVLKKEINQTCRTKKPLSLLMIDIDDFKHINDTYGHQEGDNVLKKLGDALDNSIREMDMAARYGGEEFSIVMPGANLEHAFQKADRLRKLVKELKFDKFSITISIGVAALGQSISSPFDLIKAADDALYKAKKEGKDKVIKAYG